MNKLRRAVGEYLALRRGLGFKLHQEGIWLAQFASFLEQRRSPCITIPLALEWATQPTHAQPAHTAHRLSVVRGFAQYRAAHDPRTEVPAHGLLPYRYHRKPPHLYSDDEIARLLRAATQLPSKTGLRAQSYTTLLGLLVVTGMRISEVVGLDRNDVDIANAVVTVRRTKFGKSRLVPLHISTRRALERYAEERDRILPKPTTTSFLVSEDGRRLTVNTVEQTFVKLSRRVGLRAPSDRRGPRLHDIRHRFAVCTLLRWYRAGIDVELNLPRLSTYLGHVHVTDTYWYLSASPELMRAVAARLEQRSGGRPA
jgi:integrase/recombinase XerD